MNISIIVFPGSNCDRDIATAIIKCLKITPQMLWHKETEIQKTDLIILPGGFSHGDYLRSGSIASRAPIMNDVLKKAKNGTPILGICNGFQILTECNLLPGALMPNSSMKFICKYVDLVSSTKNYWIPENEISKIISYPIAHQDGNYFASSEIIQVLENENRIILKYCSNKGKIDKANNPNGSINNIAGITNKTVRIFGMMPHPERAISKSLGGSNGISFFKNLIEWLG